MPKFGVPTSTLQQPAWPPAGVYEFHVKSFKPGWTNDKKSRNLNPRLEICNTPGNFLCDDKECAQKHSANGAPGHSFNGSMPAFITGNEKAMFIMEAMVHALGHEMVEEVDPNTGEAYSFIPGAFNAANENDPTTWQYSGPLTDPTCTGKLEVTLVDAKNKAGQIVGKKNNISQFFCKVAGCTVKHPTELK